MYVRGPRSKTDEPGQLPEPVFFNPEATHSPPVDTQNESVKSLEERGTKPPTPLYQKAKKRAMSGSFKAKFLRRSPAVAIIGILFGGISIFGLTFGPGLTLNHFDQVLTKDVNSQLAAYTKTDQQLWRTKLKNITSGCGAVKIACKFKTVNVNKTEKMFKRAGIQLEFDTSKGWGQNRGKITKMTYTDQFNKTTVIANPSDFDKAMKSNPEFHSAMRDAYNPKFASLKDSSAVNFLKKMKTSYAKKLTGTTEKELDTNMKDAVSGKTTLDYAKMRPEKDKDGNNTGRFIDENGEIHDDSEARGLKVTEDRINSAPSTRSLLKSAAKGALITSYMDTACTVYKMSQAVETAAKLIRAREEIRYAMVLHNTASAMRAGDATPEQVEYLGKKITEPDMRQTIVDESAWNKPGTANNPPMIPNPNYKKSGLDSEFFKMSAYQDTPKITAENQQFMAGGNGLNGTFSKVNSGVQTALGTTSPQKIRSICRVIQNPIIRGGSLVIGIAAGVGSLGWMTALGVGGSLSFAMALPYLTSMLADIVAGNVTSDLTGTQMIDAASVGSSELFNGQARAHGLMPLSPEQMADYQNSNRQVQVAYEQDDARKAKQTPFDIYNQYSFLGSLAASLTPISIAAVTNTTTMLTVIPMTFSTAISNLFPNSMALVPQKVTPERYQQCNDQFYKQHNWAADPTCVLIFGLPPEAMAIDPVENAEWMAAHGEIDPNSEDGAAKDNGADWNYVKYLKNCVDQQPGAHEDPDDDDNGAQCGDPAYFTQNWHYAKYKLSVDVADGQDGNLPGVDAGSQDDFGNGQNGMVGQNGWAYPTTNDASITSPFGERGGATHRGVDLVPAGGAVDKPIFAARDGKVIAAGPASGFGDWIVITSMVDGRRYDTVYGHMFDSGVLVHVGDTVKAGQQIGKIGYNGEVSPPGPNGAHLHFEVWEDGHANFANGGHAIDPAPILRAAITNNQPNSTEVRL